jgi:hypothetical protein
MGPISLGKGGVMPTNLENVITENEMAAIEADDPHTQKITGLSQLLNEDGITLPSWG